MLPTREHSAFESNDAASAAKQPPSSTPFKTTSSASPAASPFSPAANDTNQAFVDAPPPLPTRNLTPLEMPTTKVAAKEQTPRHRVVPGEFGHDPDYHWIQGTLERHYHGDTCIRYADPAVEDQYGGKVRVEEDRLLAQFHEGDVLGLEGEIVPPSERDRPGSAPRFLIHDVWLARQK
jgi:hypothetical protein